MNNPIVSETEPYQTPAQMASEHVHMELLEAQDRISDLESQCESYRTLATTTLDVLRRMTLERDQLRRLLDHWIFEERQRRRPQRNRRAAA